MNNVTGESDSSGERRRKVRRRLSDEEVAARNKKRRRIQIGCGVGVLAVVGFAGWLGYEGLQAKSNLEKAQDFAMQAKDALLSGDTEAATRAAGDADRYAQEAQGSVDSFPWRAAGAVPWLGSPFDSTRQMTTIVTGLTEDVLLPAVDAGSAVSPDQLILDGARINLAALRDAAPVLETTAAAITDLDAQAQEVDGTYIGLLNDARLDLQDQVSELSGLLNNTSTAAQIAPAMLGADGPRSYFVAFQTNAEARATGGLLGGYGVIHADDGTVKVADLATTLEIRGEFDPIDLGSDFNQLYGHSRPTTFFANSNVSSHFPYAAQIWRSIWSQTSGQLVDGVIATDPVALSYVLEAIGPITMPDGEVVSSHNVVELTESTAYVRFAGDNAARKLYLQTIAQKTAEKMTGNIANPKGLLVALGRAANEGRLSVWSADPKEQSTLAQTKIGHTVPDDPAPYAGIVINNLAGNKMDYYLRREIEYYAESCDDDRRNSSVTVRLTNDAPSENLPSYVSGAYDESLKVEPGTNLTDLSLVATQGAKLKNVTINGRSAMSFTGKELGHPVISVQFPIPRGETVEIVYTLTEPTSSGEVRIPIQPLVDTPKVTSNAPVC